MCPTSQVAVSKTSFSFFSKSQLHLHYYIPFLKEWITIFLKIIFSQQVVPQQVFPSRYFVLDTLSPFTSHPHLLFILTHLPMAPSQNSGFGGFLFFYFHSLDCSRLSQIKLRGVDHDDLGVPYRIDEDLQFISQYNINRFSGKTLELKF